MLSRRGGSRRSRDTHRWRRRNRVYLAGRFTSDTPASLEALALDPQTSGGLLAAVEPGRAPSLVSQGWWDVGKVESGPSSVVLTGAAALSQTHDGYRGPRMTANPPRPTGLIGKPIYLDYNATTPVDPRVADALRPYLSTFFGNPSSSHSYGPPAHDAIRTARARVARLAGTDPQTIVFTGSGSEANLLAIPRHCAGPVGSRQAHSNATHRAPLGARSL